MKLILFFIIITLTAQTAHSQERYSLQSVDSSQRFKTAIEKNTRTATGVPGINYWQQYTWYTIHAQIDPITKRLTGSAEIVYKNNSPDTLFTINMDLYQNVHAPGAMRNEPAEVTGGMNIERLTYNNVPVTKGQSDKLRYSIADTRLTIYPDVPVLPDDSVAIGISWNFIIPQAGAGGRMGYDSENLFFLAYWYPQMTVYDDVLGWHPDNFLINAEFYHGFADYDLNITMPGDWVVMATGGMVNPQDNLAPHVYERYKAAQDSDDTVQIITGADFGSAATTASMDETLTWRFKASRVRDVAFHASKMSFWDSARSPVLQSNDNNNTEYTQIHAFYRESAPFWKSSVAYQQHAITYFSEYTGLPYPWPHMTAVEAGNIIGGGMEFPMMTIIGDYNFRGAAALQSVTAHELAHMWIPMIVSTDERRYSWIDEGYTTYHTNMANDDFRGVNNSHKTSQMGYLSIAGSDDEGEIMRHSDYHYNTWAFRIASYNKPAVILTALKGVLGEEVFNDTHKALIDVWKYKHMYPWDLFNFFNTHTGKNLDWFWRSWYYETITLDQYIAKVTENRRHTLIEIRDNGEIPMPVLIRVISVGDAINDYRIEVEEWFKGNGYVILQLPKTDIRKIIIDPDHNFPDVNRMNNEWKYDGQ